MAQQEPTLRGASRLAKLFRNNRSQAVRIPADFEFQSDRVLISKEGDRLIIEQVRRLDLLELFATLEPLAPEDDFPEIDDTLLPLKDVGL